MSFRALLDWVDLKEGGARALQAEMAVGALLLPNEAPWLDALLEEFVTWTAVGSELQVGALATTALAYDRTTRGILNEQAHEPIWHRGSQWPA